MSQEKEGMSGARPKRGLGPDRPSKKKQSYNRAPEPSDTVPVGAGEAHSPPALTNRPFLEGRVPVSWTVVWWAGGERERRKLFSSKAICSCGHASFDWLVVRRRG